MTWLQVLGCCTGAALALTVCRLYPDSVGGRVVFAAKWLWSWVADAAWWTARSARASWDALGCSRTARAADKAADKAARIIAAAASEPPEKRAQAARHPGRPHGIAPDAKPLGPCGIALLAEVIAAWEDEPAAEQYYRQRRLAATSSNQTGEKS